MSYRTVLTRLGGVALVAATVAGGGTALAAPMAHPAHPARAASLVPVSKVGLGWSIAEYSTAPIPPKKGKGVTTLYAVSPQGKKYKFYSWPAASQSAASYQVVDWSGDGQRVLVANFRNDFEQISVATGKVIDKFKLPNGVAAVGYTRPQGENVLAADPLGDGFRRYDFTGHLTQVLTTKGFAAIESPDGTSVIVGTKSGLQEVSNSGAVIKNVNTPIGVVGCQPQRWWNATTVLANCNAKHGPGAPRLWLFSMTTGHVSALTAQRSGPILDQGDIDAWKLTSGVYLQSLGPCGVEYVGNLAGKKVSLPGVSYASYHIVTGQGSSLLVEADNGCSAGASLVWFNPGAKKVSWVFHSPKNIIGVEEAVPFGRPLS